MSSVPVNPAANCRLCHGAASPDQSDATIQLGDDSFGLSAAFSALSEFGAAVGQKRVTESASDTLSLCSGCSAEFTGAVRVLWKLAAANEYAAKYAGNADKPPFKPTTTDRFRQQFAPAVAADADAADAATTTLTPPVNDLWAKFRPASDSWECPGCMLRNQAGASKCVSCETRKPAADKKAASVASKPVTTDLGFANLVAQQSANNKWECSGCMTRNEAHSAKCVCCETAKPGQAGRSGTGNSTLTASSQFSFGGAAQKSAFTFGVPFNAGATAAAEGASLKASASAPTAFTFGVQPAEKKVAAAEEEEEEDDDDDDDDEEDASPAKRFKK